MKVFSKIKPKLVIGVLILILMIIFIINSEIYLQSIKDGLNLYVVCVLPSMLPFFFFSKILTEINFGNTLAKYTYKPFQKLFRAPPISAFIFVMSILCGYPVGAKLIGECYENNLISDSQAKKISTFCSTSGPLFIVGAVGVAMFDNKLYGFILLFAHYLGALINGFIYRPKKKNTDEFLPLPTVNSDDVLNKSMLNSFLSIGLVGGYITIFNMMLDLLTNVGIIPLISDIFYFLKVDRRLTSGVAGGLIEMTKGCLMLSKSGFSPHLILPLCEFLITFGGLSVTFQSMSFLSKTKISPAFYLLSKLSQGIISSIICYLLSLLI